MKICRHCGQPAPNRCGVILPPLKTRIFDVIAGYSKRGCGISTEDLAGRIYPGVPALRARDKIKSHVCQINDQLAETDYSIHKSDPDGYRLIEQWREMKLKGAN